MTKVVVLTDTTDYKLPPAVEASYNTAVQAAIATGVQNAIAGSGDTATAVANAVTAMTTAGILKNANVLPSAAKNLITGWFHCDGYGADKTGATISTSAIQAALTAAGNAYNSTNAVQTVYLPAGKYAVDAVVYYKADGTQDGIMSLALPSGVRLIGDGTIRVKDAAYGNGALYAVIRTPSNGIHDSLISGITIDGNRANQVASQQCSNILIEADYNVEVSNTTQVEANGNAILIRGSSDRLANGIRITGNKVFGANMIGLQASHFNGLILTGNLISGVVNNCIDVYGENGNTTAHAANFVINDNFCVGGLTGIFLETVASGVTSGNYMEEQTEAGIHVNRINGEPTRLNIVNNSMDNMPAGVAITGDAGIITIRANMINRVSLAGIRLGGGGGNVSGLNITDNTIDTATPNAVALVLVQTQTPKWDRTRIRRTMTMNTNRAYDVVNYATTTTGSVSYDQANT